MTFQPVPNTAKYAVILDRGGNLMVNTFHFERAGSWGLNELQSGAVFILNVYRERVMEYLATNVVLRRVESRGLRGITDFSSVTIAGTRIQGRRGVEAAAGNVAFAIKHTTGRAGRSSRGRTYFGGFARNDVSSDRLEQAVADGLVNALHIILDGMAQIGWRMVVVSRFEGRQRRPAGVTHLVTGFAYTDTTVDSQRRRLPGRGL